ncbi:hypothetical protein VCHC17A1_1384B, partial [Vibrio cholerae HC-17A1]
RNS